MSRPVLRIWPALPKSVIRPEIYGHFAEHAGRCVYEGIWVGEGSRIPNENGLRLDVLAALKHLRAPVLRWPGGRFADDYHWRDGVGPRADRPVTANIWWQQGEPNEFGTAEFVRLCRAVGCQPYFCVNIGSGSPREARDWVEYCNFGGESSLSATRGRDGSPEPYGVKYWRLGNESWGRGGRFSGTDYAKEFAQYGNYMKGLDPSVELFACGGHGDEYCNPAGNDWKQDFCASMRHPDLLDHMALHRYFARGGGGDFAEDDYRGLFAEVSALERDLALTEALLKYHYPGKEVGIAVDEWGMWHPEAKVENGLEQAHTLRDALLAGSVLNLFNRWSHRVTMANLAQTVNVLQCLAMTQGNRMFLTPTYYVFEMMRPHMGGRLLTQEVEGPTYSAHGRGERTPSEITLLDASASLSGRKVALTVVNRSVDSDIEALIQLRECRVASVSAKVMTGATPKAENTFAVPSAVTAKRTKSEAAEDGTVVHVFPRHSLTSLTITLE